MATLPNLSPNADGSIATAVITRSTGAGTYFSHIDEDPTTGQPDSDYLFNSGANAGDSFFEFTNTPTDFQSMDTISVVTYVVPVGRVDDNIDFRVGIFDSTETTLLAGDSGGTQGALVSGAANPSGQHTTSLTLTTAGSTADKATWDVARVRLNWIYSATMAKDTYDLRVHAVRLTGAYTQAAAGENFTRSPSSNVGLTDSAAAVQEHVRSIADSLGLTDVPSAQLITAVALSDALGITDQITPESGSQINVTIANRTSGSLVTA